MDKFKSSFSSLPYSFMFISHIILSEPAGNGRSYCSCRSRIICRLRRGNKKHEVSSGSADTAQTNSTCESAASSTAKHLHSGFYNRTSPSCHSHVPNPALPVHLSILHLNLTGGAPAGSRDKDRMNHKIYIPFLGSSWTVQMLW